MKIVYTILISTLIGAAIGFGLSYLILVPQIQDISAKVSSVDSILSSILESSNKTIHATTLNWSTIFIPSGTRKEGYVRNWTTAEAIRILQIDVWMGNPYNITWEGDTFVSLNNTIDPWNPPEDTVLIHYQFDSHAPSNSPHQRSFDLRPGFLVDASQTLYVYRLFNNFDEKETEAGDGWVMLYYLAE